MHEQSLLLLRKKVIQSASTCFANVQTTDVQDFTLGMLLCTTAESHQTLAVVQRQSGREFLQYPQSSW